MSTRQKLNLIVVSNDSSEDSSPPTQRDQEEVVHDTEFETSVPLAKVRRVFNTPIGSPLSTPCQSPTWAFDTDHTTSTLASADEQASTIKLILDKLGSRPNVGVQAKQEDNESSLSSIKSLSPPPDLPLPMTSAPGRYPSPLEVNRSLTSTCSDIPPGYKVKIQSSQSNMNSSMDEHSAGFEAESAKLRAEARSQMTHKRAEEMTRGTKMSLENRSCASSPFETVQAPTAGSLIVPALETEGQANDQQDSNEHDPVKQDLDGNQDQDGLARRSVDEHSEETVMQDQTTLRQRTITDLILEEVHTSNRSTFAKGDAAVIMGTSDLMSTLLMPFDQLSRAAPNLCKEALGVTTVAPLKLILSLEQPSRQDQHDMPFLAGINPNLAVSDFMRAHRKPHTRARAAAEEVKLNEKVKKEEQPEEIEEFSKEDLPVDWKKAYETIFAIIHGQLQGRVFKMLTDNKSPLLPQIEGIIAIANKYELLGLDSLNTTFSLLLLKFIKNHTLWKAVARQPVKWLMVGFTTRNDMIYEEALKHVCGMFRACEGDMKLAQVPDEITTLVRRKSQGVRHLQLAVDQELLTLDLTPSPRSSKKKASRVSVLNEQDTVVYQIQAVFRGYICAQIRLLEGGAHGDHRECDYTVAGFYRTIRNGGVHYLAANDVVADWKFGKPLFDEGTIRDSLKRLKSHASTIALPLARSTLQYEDKEILQYLTCLDVEESDVPWKKDEEADAEED